MDLFTDAIPDVPYGYECPECGWAAYVTESQRKAHRCDGFDLDRAVATFLNRWIPRVLSEDNRPTIEAELRELIADAKEHA